MTTWAFVLIAVLWYCSIGVLWSLQTAWRNRRRCGRAFPSQRGSSFEWQPRWLFALQVVATVAVLWPFYAYSIWRHP